MIIRKGEGIELAVISTDIGKVAGFRPMLVMDVWEQAFLLDYNPAERPKYIEAFSSNIDWNFADERMLASGAASSGAGGDS